MKLCIRWICLAKNRMINTPKSSVHSMRISIFWTLYLTIQGTL